MLLYQIFGLVFFPLQTVIVIGPSQTCLMDQNSSYEFKYDLNL